MPNNLRPDKSLRGTLLLPEYEPEVILNFGVVNGVEMFYVKWKGQGGYTWVAVEELDDYPSVLHRFLAEQVNEHHDIMFQLGQAILSGTDLLTGERLFERIPDVAGVDLKALTIELIIKFLAIMHLNQSESYHEGRLIGQAQDLLQRCITRLLLELVE